MTSYLTQNLCGPVISPYIANDKGGFVNRTKCAGEQLRNDVTSSLKYALVGATGYGALKVIAKKPSVAKTIIKNMNKLIQKIPFENLSKKLLNLSGKAKLIGLVTVPTLLALSSISHKYAYQAGQIDQKYTDRAKIAI